jgi:hypothetical protein
VILPDSGRDQRDGRRFRIRFERLDKRKNAIRDLISKPKIVVSAYRFRILLDETQHERTRLRQPRRRRRRIERNDKYTDQFARQIVLCRVRSQPPTLPLLYRVRARKCTTKNAITQTKQNFEQNKNTKTKTKNNKTKNNKQILHEPASVDTLISAAT